MMDVKHLFNKDHLKNYIKEKLYDVIYSPALSKYPKTPEARRNLAMSINVYYDPMKDDFIIESNHPGFKYLDKGVRPHIMSYLLDRTVPIKSKEGMIFRRVSAKSLLEGKWRHSGIPPQRYIDKTVDLMLKDKKVRQLIIDEVFTEAGYKK